MLHRSRVGKRRLDLVAEVGRNPRPDGVYGAHRVPESRRRNLTAVVDAASDQLKRSRIDALTAGSRSLGRLVAEDAGTARVVAEAVLPNRSECLAGARAAISSGGL